MARNDSHPNYVLCEIVRTDNYDGYEQAYIRIGGSENVVGDTDIIAVCRDLDELKALAVPDFPGDLPLSNVRALSSGRSWRTKPTGSRSTVNVFL